MQTLPTSALTRSALKKRAIRGDIVAACFLLPFTILYTVFTIYPVLQGGYISFFKWNLMGKQGYVGFNNYQTIFGDSFFWLALWNTTKFVLYSTPVIMISSLGLALLANRATKAKRVYRTIYFLPNLLSVSVISYIAIFMAQPYDMGFLSKLMHTLGVDPNYEIFWLKDKHLAWVTVVVATLWWTQGYNMMLYVSALQDIPDRLYEAASIDGATPKQQLFYVTLPMLKPTVITLTLMSIGRIFYSDFGLFYQVPQNSGALFPVTQTIDTYVYRGLMELNDVGMSAAAGLYQSLVGFVLVLLANWIVRKIDSDNALF